MKKIMLILALGPAFILAGCVNYDTMYTLDADYLAQRQASTRQIEGKSHTEALAASAQVLQDLGFTIDESNTTLGLITATKDREAGSTAGRVFNILFGGQEATYDVRQRIFANLVATPADGGHSVRVLFARIIWNNKGDSRREKVTDAATYRDFFDKLSQSVFLTTHDI